MEYIIFRDQLTIRDNGHYTGQYVTVSFLGTWNYYLYGITICMELLSLKYAFTLSVYNKHIERRGCECYFVLVSDKYYYTLLLKMVGTCNML